MDIWITRNGRATECKGCGMPIATGETVVRGRLWGRNKPTEEGKPRWSRTLTWHARNKDGLCCWLEEGILKVEQTPRVETRGRKALGLSKSDNVKRVSLLKRRGSVMQRLKREAGRPEGEKDYDRIINLGEQLEEIKTEVERVGGVPESWQ